MGARLFNGWQALAPESKLLYTWTVPAARPRGEVPLRLRLRQGSCGFLLVHNAMWFDEAVERLDIDKILDDWGYADRPPSNHGGGLATDLNSTRHPFHVPTLNTFTRGQVAAINKHLKLYDGVIEWGGNWNDPDGMHFEIAPGTTMGDVERVARELYNSNARRVKQIHAANPSQRKVVFS